MSWRDEFNELNPSDKLSLCAAWFFAASLCFFLSCSLYVVVDWFTRRDVPEITKKAFVLGLGASISGLMFGCGATMQGDRLAEAELESLRERVSNCSQKADNHRCQRCKYYSTDNSLHCAVNPKLVLTDAVTDCFDWEEVE